MTTRTPADTAIFYPETDGMPLPDGEYQAPIYREIVNTIQTYFSDSANVRVNGDTFIYYQEGNPNLRIAPDCYVVSNLSEFALKSLSLEGNNTYLLWEVGKPPDFVLEIGSPSTARVDLGRKRDLYAELGVGEYWRFDASGGDFYGEPLVGEYLVDGEYRRFDLMYEDDGLIWARSEALGLDLWWDGEGRLRFYDPGAGIWLLNQEEENAARLSAEVLAEEERTARLSAEARLAEMEAEL